MDNQKTNGPHHYFASFTFGWAVAPTREEAIEKLVNAFRSEVKKITQISHKEGSPGCYIWTCRVNESQDTRYKIDMFQPVDVDIDEGRHHHVTYVTAKKIAHTTETDLARGELT